MSISSSKFTVLFENPFWIGLYECSYKGKYQVMKITFGAEPKDAEVYEFFLKNFNRFRLSNSIKCENHQKSRENPKRIQREISKELKEKPISSKAFEALRIEQEKNKLQRKVRSKEEILLEKQKRFEQKREKRKEKHRGH